MPLNIIRCFNFKRISTLALLLFALFVSPLTVKADDFSISNGVLTQYNGPGGSVVIPSNVDVIGGSAFRDNTDVISVTIPEGCVTIQDGAFDGCRNLRTVSLPNTLTSIGTLSFARCENLEYVILPSHLESIGDGAFWNCLSIGSITVPASVTEIGNFSFAGCINLVLLNVEPENRNYVSIDNVLFTSDMKTLKQYAVGSTGKSYTIPEGVEEIGVNAFNRAQNLKEIKLPSTLKELTRALSGCTGLTTLDLPASLQKVNEYAFQNCTNLCRLYVHNKDQETVVKAFLAVPSLVIYGPDSSRIQDYAKRYNIRFKLLNDETYTCPDTEQKF